MEAYQVLASAMNQIENQMFGTRHPLDPEPQPEPPTFDELLERDFDRACALVIEQIDVDDTPAEIFKLCRSIAAGLKPTSAQLEAARMVVRRVDHELNKC